MKKTRHLILGVLATLGVLHAVSGEVRVTTGHQPADEATSQFAIPGLPRPVQGDAATNADFILVDGRADRNGGPLARLNDDQLPRGQDQPSRNFFFAAGTDGGRLLVDLGRSLEISHINTYSWHPGDRGPQVYELFVSDGGATGFVVKPDRETDPTAVGWQRLASVDTRPPSTEPAGGQYAASLSDSEGRLGKFRYLLFDTHGTENRDAFGNTFFSEIDIIERGASERPPIEAPATGPPPLVVATEGGTYQLVLDASQAPELADWVRTDLAPVVREWYPRVVNLLPSEGYEAPRRVTIVFDPEMAGVAATGGTRIGCAVPWFLNNLDGEAKGAVVHELVHAVQQYGRARRTNPNATRTPGWLVEGIADYIRWFLYEPDSTGAQITRRNLSRARHDASYRITGNFLNWAIETHGQELLRQLNAAARESRYTEDLWHQVTGKSLQELDQDWRTAIEQRLDAAQ